jgi:hypothetical protein
MAIKASTRRLIRLSKFRRRLNPKGTQSRKLVEINLRRNRKAMGARAATASLLRAYRKV